MIRIDEVFDAPERYNKISRTEFSFFIESIKYIVTIDADYSDYLTKKLKKYFNRNGIDYRKRMGRKDSRTYDLGFGMVDEEGNQIFHITGVGNQFKVFSTVAEIFEKELIKSFNPNFIRISADAKETSRVRLYSIFMKEIEKRTNYTLFEIDYNDRSAGYKEQSFYLVKNSILEVF